MAQSNRLKVLFLCTGNSCRSQMAEGWARHLKSDSIEAFSAGTNPQGLNPLAIKVMSELGIDIATQSSKHVDSLSEQHFDFVITLCDSANDACPIFPGNAKKIHVPFDDPPRLAAGAKTEEEALVHYRHVRDEIQAFIMRLPQGFVNIKG